MDILVIMKLQWFEMARLMEGELELGTYSSKATGD